MGGLLLRFERERERERKRKRERKSFFVVELFIGGKKVFVVERENNNCVYIFFVSFCPPFFLAPLKRTL